MARENIPQAVQNTSKHDIMLSVIVDQTPQKVTMLQISCGGGSLLVHRRTPRLGVYACVRWNSVPHTTGKEKTVILSSGRWGLSSQEGILPWRWRNQCLTGLVSLEWHQLWEGDLRFKIPATFLLSMPSSPLALVSFHFPLSVTSSVVSQTLRETSQRVDEHVPCDSNVEWSSE